MSNTPVFGTSLSGGVEVGNRTRKQRGVKVVKSPEEIALESKLIQSPVANRGTQTKSRDGTPYPSGGLAGAVINDTARNIVDARNLTQLLPDIKTARLLLVSAIQSPNDLVSCKLTYNNDTPGFGNIKSGLLEIIENHFESVHKMDECIPRWLDDILFAAGSKILLTLPDSQLDDIINSDLSDRENRLRVESFVNDVDGEGYLKPIGLLGTPKKDVKVEKQTTKSILKRAGQLGTEGYDNSLGKTFHHIPKRTFSIEDNEKKIDALKLSYGLNDNPDILKMTKLNQAIAQEEARRRVANLYLATPGTDSLESILESELGTESFNNDFSTLELDAQGAHGVIRRRETSWKPVTSVREKVRNNRGEPSLFDVPPECAVPAFFFGNPEDHCGYYFAIDETGNFLSISGNNDYYRDMVAAKDPNENAAGQMIDQVATATYGATSTNYHANLREEQQNLSASIINNQLLQALEYGTYKGVKLTLGNTDGITKLMLAHALQGDRVQFLFVPKDLVSYIAFDYNDFGVGVSLLAQNKMQGSIRSMLQFAATQAAMNNAVVHTRLNITLDEFDSDAARTVEGIFHENVRRKVAAYPLGISSPLDQLEYMAAAATEINVENHPAWPGTKVEHDFYNHQMSVVDPDLLESAKKDFLLGLGVSPESIDMSMGVELAQTIVSSNIMLAKRSIIYQDKFCGGVTTHLKNYCVASESVKTEMTTFILENMDEFKGQSFYSKLEKATDQQKRAIAYKLALMFLSNTNVTLPRPDLKTMEMQLDGLETKSDFYDKVLEHVVSEDLLADFEVGEDIADKAEHFTKMFKNYLMRQYIQEQNIAPELFTLLGYDQDSEKVISILEQNKTLKSKLGRAFAGYVKEVKKEAENIDNIATNAGRDEDTGGGFSSTTDDDTGSTADATLEDTSLDDGAGAFGNEDQFTNEVPGEPEP